MPISATEIEELIKTGLKGAEAIVDGDGTHFNAFVMSPDFIGKSRLAKQQLVNETVKKQLLDGSLHALSIKTFTPDEWQDIIQEISDPADLDERGYPL
ncbi:MAG TPA: BolA/IbaG family iron-sulfur metabolism protein [Gammaproteobacteria bacterium]|nr:BolA/IbaG family iron-sulfur metabolism protein [Gammaproteobacteria bacterium]